MKLWKSPALYFGILLILAIAGALIAPYALDWSRYRGDIAAYGSQLTGPHGLDRGPDLCQAVSVSETRHREGQGRQSRGRVRARSS